jgi:hypothetical protein
MLDSPELLARIRASVGRMFKRDGVPDTGELRRIINLPRRVWTEDPRLDELVEALTAYLKTPTGTMTLWPAQAKALEELHDLGFLFGKIPIGEGKTLTSFLAPVVLDTDEKFTKALLVVPAKLREKTYREFAVLRQHWRSSAWTLREPVVSYEQLSREGGTAFLEESAPDLLILDEAHRLKNTGAACTRRINTYVEAHRPRVVAMSGTFTLRSLLDFAHVLRWSMPGEKMPLPQVKEELEVWAAALDEMKFTDKRTEVDVGALKKLCNGVDFTRAGVREAFKRRMDETPGIVAVETDGCAASLNVVLTPVIGYNEKTRELARKLRAGEKPNGDPVTDNDLAARWRIFRTLTSGFWYTYEIPPPKEWLQARLAWKRVVRRVLEEHLPGFESEALVAKAAANNKLGFAEDTLYQEWKAVRDTFDPKTVPVWVDDRMIRFVDDWRKEHVGIIWVSEVALGDKLQEDLGLPYFHELGLCGKKFIEAADPKEGCIVASVESNNEGRNLQHRWSDNLIISLPPTGNVDEQLVGRTHRPGQEADEVDVEVAMGCSVEYECWTQAMRDVRYAEAIEGSKKLTRATVSPFALPKRDGALWG